MATPTWSQTLWGSTPGVQQFPERYSPQQRQFQQQSIPLLMNILSQVSQPSDISGLTSNIRRQFETKTIPSLAERFVGHGGSTPQGSSAFQSALGGAAAGLESNLGALQTQASMQDKDRLLKLFGLLSGIAQTPQKEFYGVPGTQGLFSPGNIGGTLGGIGGGIGTLLSLLSSWF